MAVSLKKGQKISLSKEAGNGLSKITMGLGWDPVEGRGFLGFGKKKKAIDLDASCVLFDEKKQVLDTVWFHQLRSKDGSIFHTGDNLTGDGEGDDETIELDLNRIPGNVKSIVFTVNSFSSHTFSEVDNAFCRIINRSNSQEIARYNLTCQGKHSAMIMAKVYRHNGEWKMHAIGENCRGQTWESLVPAMLPHL